MDATIIQCQVCHRSPYSRLPFWCQNCARHALYELRFQHIQALLTRESLGREIEDIGARDENPAIEWDLLTKSKRVDGQPSNRLVDDQRKSEQQDVMERTGEYCHRMAVLQNEIREMKDSIARRRALLAQHRKALSTMKDDLVRQEALALHPLQKAIAKTGLRWDALHTKTAESREFLCREVAHLYGLQQLKRQKGLLGRDGFMIGGIHTVDLRDINNAHHSQITVSVTHLAHLLHLTSHYLGLRLPAEISLPSANSPFAQIFSPLSSYNNPTVIVPTSKSASSSSTATRAIVRSRPLHLERPLLTLAAEEPLAYSHFIDAVTLLAWDVAWLCRTQGLDISARSWEDICAVGRNMWLLLGTTSRPTLIPISSTPKSVDKAVDNTTSAKPSLNGAPVFDQVSTKPQASPLGFFSHCTSHSFLNAADGEHFMQGWKLANPVRVIEKVKAALASERVGAEWELLEDGEWEGREKQEIIKRGAEYVRRDDVTAKDLVQKDNGLTDAKTKEKGTSGWMKLKSRGSVP